VEGAIRDKLNEELMRQTAPKQDRWYVTRIFHREEVVKELPDNATSEQIVESAKRVSKETSRQIRREFATKAVR